MMHDLFSLILGVAYLTYLIMIFLYVKRRIFPPKTIKKHFITKSQMIVMGYIFMIGIFYFSDWPEFETALQNPMKTLMMDIHTPISSQYSLTIIILSAVSVLGYCCIEKRGLSLSPLVSVILLGSIWIGIALSVIFIIHTSNYSWVSGVSRYILIIYPINYIIFSIKLMREYVKDYSMQLQKQTIPYKNCFLQWLSGFLLKATNWMPLSVMMMLPILILVIGILTLFGQRPDAVILAFTQTSDWVFSKMIAPEPIYHSGHYLCTASMGGHPNIVKPIRYGERRGEHIVVNRQLLIANAFEQLLEERFPRSHYIIRSTYDRYGYPIAKHMKTPLSCDIVYLLMKPLEYLFLVVLYLFDVKPENRIAMQYLSSDTLKEIQRVYREI